MSEKTEALRLAEFCEGNVLYQPAAAELRRLHQFAEDQIGRATAAEAALQMTKATHALKIAAVEAQRDALLGLLKEARKIIRASSSRNLVKDWDQRTTDAIKAVEGESHAKNL